MIEQLLHIGLEGLVVQQLQQGALKGFTIRVMLKLIAGKMDIIAPARRLPTEIAKIEQVVGADQHVHHPRHVRHGLDPIELVEEFRPTGHLHQMLGFIDDDGPHAPPDQRVFQGLTQFRRVMELRDAPWLLLRVFVSQVCSTLISTRLHCL